MSGAEQHSRLALGFHSTEVLYRGADSTVYRALRDGDDHPVALKVMRDGSGSREADRLVELSGTPGLVTAIGGGRTSSGRAFVAMDLHPAGDYASVLADRGPLPLAEALAVGRSVAGALAALHGRGLLHHRIEPGNILSAPGGGVLTDVGGVLPADQRTEPVGLDPVAVAYASPEALSGQHPLTPASDVYRLGAVLWTLLAGHPPFAEGPGSTGDPFTYRERALAGELPRLPRSDLSAPLRAVLERALSRDPAQRQSAADLARELGGPELGGPDLGGRDSGGGEPGPGLPEAADPNAVVTAAVEPTSHGGPGTSPDSSPSSAPEPVASDGDQPAEPGEGRDAHGGPPARSDNDPARFLADHPEIAWASLPGWAGGASAESPAGTPGQGTATAVPGQDQAAPDTALVPGQASPGYHWDQSQAPPQPPVPPQPPAPPEPPASPGPVTRPPGQPGRRPLFIGVTVAAIAFVAVVLGLVAVLRPGVGGDLLAQARTAEPVPDASDTPAASGTPDAPAAQPGGSGENEAPPAPALQVEEAAPTDLGLEDSGHTVLVTWTDNTEPAANHQVIGGPAGQTPGNLADAEPGSGQARVSGLEPDQEYCFVVVAVLSVEEIAPSEQVCTDRSATV